MAKPSKKISVDGAEYEALLSTGTHRVLAAERSVAEAHVRMAERERVVTDCFATNAKLVARISQQDLELVHSRNVIDELGNRLRAAEARIRELSGQRMG